MLYQLTIHDVAIIEAAEVAFSSGLNILTGETGAGKSILIDSLNLVLGARANRELIRKPARSARVEAVFGDLNPEVTILLESWGVSTEDGELILSREIWDNGRSVARANGSLLGLGQLKELGILLVDVHGQHEYRYLLDPGQHTRILNGFAGEKAEKLLSDLRELSIHHRRCREELEQSYGDEEERERRMDILRYQIREIEAADLRPGEEAELEEERRIMQHAERLKEAVQTSYRMLNGDDGENGRGAQSLIGEAASILDHVSEIDSALGDPAEKLQQTGYELEDVIETLRDMADRFDFDGYRLEEIENRLALIHSLEKKYGKEIESVLEFHDDALAEYERYQNADETVAEIRRELAKMEAQWEKKAEVLTKLRKETARNFENAVMEQMKDLGMKDGRFEVRLTPVDRPMNAGGAETAAFWLSANKGEETGPLEKVASGGELSRIMLALKSVIAATDDIPTMVFDEIDAGISGNMARVVGEKLLLIAEQRQVLCITHTAQIAAMGDEHYLIEKDASGERTVTKVMELSTEQRIQEIGRLIGRDMTGEIGETNAREMLRWCEKYKEKRRNLRTD